MRNVSKNFTKLFSNIQQKGNISVSLDSKAPVLEVHVLVVPDLAQTAMVGSDNFENLTNALFGGQNSGKMAKSANRPFQFSCVKK